MSRCIIVGYKVHVYRETHLKGCRKIYSAGPELPRQGPTPGPQRPAVRRRSVLRLEEQLLWVVLDELSYLHVRRYTPAIVEQASDISTPQLLIPKAHQKDSGLTPSRWAYARRTVSTVTVTCVLTMSGVKPSSGMTMTMMKSGAGVSVTQTH